MLTRILPTLTLAAALGLMVAPAAALDDPQTSQMIEALKPAPAAGLRNLVLRARPDTAAGAASAASAPATVLTVPPLLPVAAASAATLPVAAAPATATAAVLASSPAIAPAPALATATAVAAPARLSLSVQFDTNSARIRPESSTLLGRLAAALVSPELKSSRFIVEGHTDGVGPAAANLRLSRERAAAVRSHLVALGVDGARLEAVGKGATELINAGDPRAAENRRVIVVTVQ